MIELGVQPNHKSVIIAEEEPAHYLILGDFGGRATEPMPLAAITSTRSWRKSRTDAAGSFRDSDRVHLAGFRAINGEELALRSA